MKNKLENGLWSSWDDLCYCGLGFTVDITRRLDGSLSVVTLTHFYKRANKKDAAASFFITIILLRRPALHPLSDFVRLMLQLPLLRLLLRPDPEFRRCVVHLLLFHLRWCGSE